MGRNFLHDKCLFLLNSSHSCWLWWLTSFDTQLDWIYRHLGITNESHFGVSARILPEKSDEWGRVHSDCGLDCPIAWNYRQRKDMGESQLGTSMALTYFLVSSTFLSSAKWNLNYGPEINRSSLKFLLMRYLAEEYQIPAYKASKMVVGNSPINK